MNYTNVAEEIAATVTAAFEASVSWPYHNLEHTSRVVAYTAEIAKFYTLDQHDLFIVNAAAWYHDIGHLYGEMENHEARGAEIMRDHLAWISDINPDTLDSIAGCILATKFPSNPQSLLQEILCDADSYHLATPLFKITDPLVHKEMEIRTGKKIPDWHSKTLKFLEQHSYHTSYCRQLLTEGLQANIHWLQSLPASAKF